VGPWSGHVRDDGRKGEEKFYGLSPALLTLIDNPLPYLLKPPFGPTNNMEKLFHNIMHQPVYYPSFLSEQGKAVLEALLCRDPTQRLGCGKDGGEEVMRHPFFAGIDFEKLLNKTYQPPFKPKVVCTTTPFFSSSFPFLTWCPLPSFRCWHKGGIRGHAQL